MNDQLHPLFRAILEGAAMLPQTPAQHHLRDELQALANEQMAQRATLQKPAPAREVTGPFPIRLAPPERELPQHLLKGGGVS